MEKQPLRLFNSLTRREEEFKPKSPGKAGIYVCGPTVQGKAHIGHMRSAVAFDVLRRWLEKSGYEVNFIRNITDIDDKILKKASQEEEEWWALAYRFERSFERDYRLLNVLPPTYEPRATGQIPEMVELVEILLEKGYAYVSPLASGEGANVYFDTEKWKEYGALTRQGRGEAPTEEAEGGEGKKNPRDFALWKAPKPGEPPSASWDAPFGKGRPGWHLECSAMSHRFLGRDFDIHGGGLDLRFPHHENEMAQSLAAGWPTASYWLHSAWVTQKGEKMSKSLGNGLGVGEICSEFSPWALRYALASVHYRSMLEWGEECGKEAVEVEKRILRFKEEAESFLGRRIGEEEAEQIPLESLPEKFVSCMNADLNVGAALAALFDLLRSLNSSMRSFGDKGETEKGILSVFSMLSVLGLFPLPEKAARREEGDPLSRLVENLIEKREKARREKDFEKADSIRRLLKEAGIALEDGRASTSWRRVNTDGGIN
ncbi:MAG: cysteine--tRNA ligase [Aeriscardovia sp.]|nr:cysteine--tRNA ligase [Aeriscardovia sp.]